MITENGWILGAAGLLSGLLAGLLGIGGGTVLVPVLIALGYSYAESVATSSLAIVMTSISGTWQNWRMGYLKFKPVIWLGLPGIVTAWLGADLVAQIPKFILKAAFGLVLLLTIYLSRWREKLNQGLPSPHSLPVHPLLARLFTGGTAGFLAGLFGIGGGVILVPLQIWFLRETLKVAIQSSLGVIVITAVSACWGHAREGNVLWAEGVILGLGGLLGAQMSTRYLPKLPEKIVQFCFSLFLLLLAGYFFVQAWQDYHSTLRVSLELSPAIVILNE